MSQPGVRRLALTMLLIAIGVVGIAVAIAPRLRSARGRPGSDPSGAAASGEPMSPATVIAVRDSESRPLGGATVHHKRVYQKEYFHSAQVPEDGSVRLKPVEPGEAGLDVVITCRGHATAVLRDVRESTDVVLQRSDPMRVVVRLGEGVELPARGTLEGWLEWYDGSGRLDPRRIDALGETSFGARRVLEFDVYDPGTYIVGIGEVLPAHAIADYPAPLRRSLFPEPFPPLVSVSHRSGPTEFVVQAVRDERR